MKFETAIGSGWTVGATYAWHEAFNSGVGSIDMRDVLNEFGVQHTAKGGDSRTMDHCDKGKIQQVVFQIKCKNIHAWAWGMYAYAPEGAENVNTLINHLFKFAMSCVHTDKFNPFMCAPFGNLAKLAIIDAATEARMKSRHRRKRSEMAELMKCEPEKYQKEYMPLFFKMKDSLRDLDAIALPPVASAVWAIVDKSHGEDGAIEALQKAMRTPREAA